MKKIVVIALLFLLFGGCDLNEIEFNNLKEPELKSIMAFPLGELTYTMRDLIDEVGDSTVEVLEDSATTLISLVYRDTIEYASDDDLIQVPDITNEQSISLGGAFGPVPMDFDLPEITHEFVFDYQPENDEQVDSVVYDDGELVFSLTSPFSTAYTFQINNIVDASGNPMIFTHTDASNTQSLANHTFSLSPQGSSNTFSADFAATVSLDSGDLINATDSITVELTIQNQSFSIIYGNFGMDTLSIGDDVDPIDMSFFKDLGEDALEFQSPEMNFEIESSFGVPIGIDFDGVYAAEEGQDTLFMEVTSSISDQTIESPPAAEAGSSLISNISIDKSNSNINELFSSTPDQLVFNIAGISNPRASDGDNFFVNGSSMTAYVEIALPMIVRLRDLSREIDFDLSSDLSELDNSDSISLRVVTINELPFEVELDLQILDSLDTVIFEVPNNIVVATPFINADGFTREPKVKISDVSLGKNGIDALIQAGGAGKLNMVIRMNTPESLNSQDIFVRVLAKYSLTVRVAVLGRIKTIP